MAPLGNPPILTTHIMLSFVACVLAGACGTPYFAGSLLLGVGLGVVNFCLLRRSCKLLVEGQSGGMSSSSGVRFAFLATAVGLALYYGSHPVGLLVGLSLIVPSAIIAAWRTRPLPSVPRSSSDEPNWETWDPWTARERDLKEDA